MILGSVDMSGPLMGLAGARRATNVLLPRAMREAADRAIVPAVRGAAPRKSGTLAASIQASIRGAMVVVWSPLPYAGLMDVGGTVRKHIYPLEEGGSLRLPDGSMVHAIHTPRTYQGTRYMERGWAAGRENAHRVAAAVVATGTRQQIG